VLQLVLSLRGRPSIYIGTCRLQGKLVSPQQRDRYCDASAGWTINAMNISANTNQSRENTTRTARATGIGFLRRSMAGARLRLSSFPGLPGPSWLN
jgi:hypothetical protein